MLAKPKGFHTESLQRRFIGMLVQAAQQQGSVPKDVAHKTDGVLLAVGGLASVLKKKVSCMYCVPSLCALSGLWLSTMHKLNVDRASQ